MLALGGSSLDVLAYDYETGPSSIGKESPTSSDVELSCDGSETGYSNNFVLQNISINLK